MSLFAVLKGVQLIVVCNEFFIEKHNFDFSTLMGVIRYSEALAEIRGQINMQVAIHRLFGLNKILKNPTVV